MFSLSGVMVKIKDGGSPPKNKNPNDFVMVTRGYWSEIRSLARRMPVAFDLLTLLTERMDKANAVVVSQVTLQELLGKGRTTIHKAIRLLEDEKWLQVVKIGTANAYVVNSKVVWRDHSGKRFGSFFAEVIVSETEQNKSVQEMEDLKLRDVQLVGREETPVSDNAELPPPDQLDLMPPSAEEFPRKAPPEGSVMTDEKGRKWQVSNSGEMKQIG